MRLIRHESKNGKQYTTVEWIPWYSWFRLLVGKQPIPVQQTYVSDNNIIFYYYPDISPCNVFMNDILRGMIETHRMQESIK